MYNQNSISGLKKAAKEKSLRVRAWMDSHKNKHICTCGCGGAIEIKLHHHSRGVPKTINGHTSRIANPMTGMKKEKNPRWTGGRRMNKYGYIVIYTGTKNSRAIYRPEHRVVMELALRRKLKRHEDVHHINGNKTDNRIENLGLMTKSEHTKLHWRNGSFKR